MNPTNLTDNSRTALYCYGSIKPDPSGCGAARRFWVDIKALESIGYNVIKLQFIYDTEIKSENVISLPKWKMLNSNNWLGHQYIKFIYPLVKPQSYFFPQYGKETSEKLFRYINKYKPDIIFFEHSAPWVAGSQLDLTIPKILCVHDFDNILKGWKSINYLRNTRPSGIRRFAAIMRARWIAYRLKKYSFSLFKKSNRVLTCGKSDADALSKLRINSKYFPIPVFQVPQKESVMLIKDRFNNKESNNNIVKIIHVGGLSGSHNSKGVSWFLSKCLPIIRENVKDNKFKINFIGSTDNTSDEILKFRSEQNLYFSGFVNNLEEELSKADFAIVPPGFQTGFRTKIPEAFAYGLPVVTGKYDAYGVGLKPNDARVMVADTPQEYAEACIRLINDPELRCKMGKVALETWQEDYDPEKVINDTAIWIEENAN